MQGTNLIEHEQPVPAILRPVPAPAPTSRNYTVDAARTSYEMPLRMCLQDAGHHRVLPNSTFGVSSNRKLCPPS